jgi:hypothetical protein
MDAALPSTAAQPNDLIGDDAMTTILELLQPELDPETFERVRDVIFRHSKMAADDEPKPRRRTAEGVENGLKFLRTKGFTEDEIDHVRKLEGFPKPSLAQDSARRERNRQRDASEFAKRFPAAKRITTTDAPAAVARTPAAPSSAQTADFEKRFPNAARLR